jgi:hypothetical protein
MGGLPGSRRPIRPPVTRAPPPTFVAVAPAGPSFTVEVRSSTAGTVTRRLATFGQLFTDNGLAVSPDGRSVYVTLIPRRRTRPFALRLIRILWFGDARPAALDRSGTHMLYLLGHHPPALWEATVAGGGLTDRHRLLPDSPLGPAAY